MPLTKVQSATKVTTANASSLTATFGATPTQNHLLVAIGNTDDALTMSNSGWSTPITSASFVSMYLWWKIAGASEPTAVTVNIPTADSAELWIAEYSGAVTASALNVSASNTASGNQSTCATGTTAATAQADELAIAAWGWGDYVSVHPITSYSNSFAQDAQIVSTGASPTTNNTHLAVATLALNATGTQSSTATWSGGTVDQPSALIATFKGTAGGGTTFNDSSAGTLVLSGAVTEAKVGTDAAAGALVFSGARSESAAFTQAAAGALVFSGAVTQAKTGTDAGTGTLVIGGAATEGKAATDAPAGTLLFSGSGSAPGPPANLATPDFVIRHPQRPGSMPEHVHTDEQD